MDKNPAAAPPACVHEWHHGPVFERSPYHRDGPKEHLLALYCRRCGDTKSASLGWWLP